MEQAPLFAVNDQLLHIIEEAPKLTIQEEKKIIADTQKLSIRYMRDLCNNAARQSMKRMVHGTQYIVCWLLNHIHEKQQKDPNLFREKIAANLASFLGFLQEHSGTWFNVHAPMPQYIWQPIHEKLLPRIEPGKAFLFEGIEQDLVLVIQKIYNETGIQSTPSFKQAQFWQALIEALTTDHQHPHYDTTRCMFTLIRYNCNHPHFIRYVFTRYLHAVAETDQPPLHWQQALLHINRIIPEKEWELLSKEISCKEAILQLIQIELDALVFTNDARTVMAVTVPYTYTLSVAQLALWIRMQIESGMIQHENTTELIRHFSEQLNISRTQGIAFKSMYNKYHQPDRAAVQIMLEYTLRMQKFLKALLQ